MAHMVALDVDSANYSTLLNLSLSLKLSGLTNVIYCHNG